MALRLSLALLLSVLTFCDGKACQGEDLPPDASVRIGSKVGGWLERTW